MRRSPDRGDVAMQDQGRRVVGRGLTLVEILIGLTIMAVGILGVVSMFGSGYTNVGQGGRVTMAVTAARQMLEDVRLIPFTNLDNLNGLDTGRFSSQPANDPEKSIARKWVYALAGNVMAWGFQGGEISQWKQLGVGTTPAFGAQGQVTVTSPSPSLKQISVRVFMPKGGVELTLVTLVSRFNR